MVNALTMTSAEELSHGVSMQLTPAYAEWKNHKINLLDTPGYLDFTGDALAAVRAADAAVDRAWRDFWGRGRHREGLGIL